jgi:predicted DNA-binding transcriptional regulator AlpA
MNGDNLHKSLRPNEQADALGVTRSTLYRWEKQHPDFPKARKLGPRCSVRDRDELLAWRDSRMVAGGV